jgi:hypothetical protein
VARCNSPQIPESLALVALAAWLAFGIRDLGDFGLTLMGPLLRAIGAL